MYMCHKGGGIGHCAVQAHSIDRNMVTLETDMEVEQEGNEVEHDLEVQFNDSDEESDADLDEGDSDSDDDLDMEENKDRLEDY